MFDTGGSALTDVNGGVNASGSATAARAPARQSGNEAGAAQSERSGLRLVASDLTRPSASAAQGELSALPPGAESAAELARLGVDEQDVGGRVDLLRAWARLESWVAAGKAAAVVAVSELGITDLPADAGGYQHVDTGTELVATALRISPRAAQSQLGWAKVLMRSCPATFRALLAGSISAQSARVVCEETVHLDDQLVAEIERLVLGRAPEQTPQQLRRALRRTIALLAPQQHAERCDQEVADRSVTLTPAPFGMAYLEAYLPAPEAQRFYSILTEVATGARDRDRGAARQAGLSAHDADLAPLGAYRADALVGLGEYAGKSLPGHGADSARWQAHVVIDLPTVLGLADNPGELRGHGPIPGRVARRLAAEAPWIRWITQAGTGRLLDVGRHRYTPSAALREFILARDQRCRFPGCEQPARRCDIDHAQSWDTGGATTPANLGALCRRHHRIKTHTDWSITESAADGSCTWRTPTGSYVGVRPEPLLPAPEPTSGTPEPATALPQSTEPAVPPEWPEADEDPPF